MKRLCLLFLLLAAVFSACDRKEVKTTVTDTRSDEVQLKESLEKANRYLVRDENEDIDNYIRRHSLEMTTTGTGLRYQIVQKGAGKKVSKGYAVTLEYKLTSIAGEPIYSSDEDGLKKFVVGNGSVESGLDEAVQYMHQGDVATIILPSHLAYGLVGDQNKIPERATLVYSIKILEIQ